MKIAEKKRLVLIGIRRKGERGFKIKTEEVDENPVRVPFSLPPVIAASLGE